MPALLFFFQTENTITDQMDLLREQVKMLAGEIALCTSTLKRLSEQAAKNPDDLHLQACAIPCKEFVLTSNNGIFGDDYMVFNRKTRRS